MVICMVANSVNAMVIVSTGGTNPHFGDFHFQNLAVITQFSTINSPSISSGQTIASVLKSKYGF